MSKQYYHYTPEIRLKEIIKSGEIKLAAKSVFHKKEKAIAWVSTNPVWENTATKNAIDNFGNQIQLTFDQQLKLFGCARIEVKKTNLMTWEKLKHKANMDLNAARAFEKTGLMKGANSSEWYGSLTPIREYNWNKIEVFKNGKWVLYNDSQK